MKTPADLTDTILIQSLRSTLCPACGGVKKTAQTVCLTDYRRLPKLVQANLYQRVGDGYREAVLAALSVLKINQVHLPAGMSGAERSA